MASLCVSATARTVQLILGFHHPSTRAEIPSINVLRFIPGASPTSPNFRFKCNGTLRVRGRFTTVSASNSNSTGGNSPNNRPNADEETDAAQGPPLLTILAGFFLFFLVCWIIGSSVRWLISLIVK